MFGGHRRQRIGPAPSGQEDFTAVVPLTKGERSRMATRAAELL
jgi:hypothetical protein